MQFLRCRFFSNGLGACSCVASSANNKVIQEGAADEGVISDILALVMQQELPEHARRRAVYALSSAVRNSNRAQRVLEDADGASQLGSLVQNSTEPVQLRKKAVVLSSDLVASGMPVPRVWTLAHTKAVHDLLGEESLDVQEKALSALQTVLHGGTLGDAIAVMQDTGMHKRVQQVSAAVSEQEGEFAADVKLQSNEVLTALAQIE